MKIYTKSGDKGTTSLFGGEKVDKNHPLIDAYGTVDELNALLGIVRVDLAETVIETKLERIQNELFSLGADLATPWSDKTSKVVRMSEDRTSQLESEIDQMESELSPLQTFIIPGGTGVSAQLHHCRTVCRRAERSLSAFYKDKKCNPDAFVYLNRLGDWLFVLARYANRLKGVSDIPWKS